MTKRPSAYHRPTNLQQALTLLAQPNTRPLGGGTKLLAGHIAAAVVDLQDLGLDHLEVSGDWLTSGAMVRLTDLTAYLAADFAADLGTTHEGWAGLFRQAIRLAGSNTYRNAATLGGSVAARLADSELLALLLVLEAVVVIMDPERREVSLADFLAAGPEMDRLITEIRIKAEAGRGASERVARTPADYPIVSVTAWAPEGKTLRLAATGIDTLPVRLTRAEQELAAGLSPEAIGRAAASAKGQARHPGDFRGDAGYRAEMAAVLTRRALAGLS